MAPTKLAIFDLDGTLLDTIVDIAAVANHALRTNGFPEHSAEQYKAFVGKGARVLIQRALFPCTDDLAVIQTVLDQFRENYLINGKVYTKPYDCITEMLRELRARKIAVAVLSNKPNAATQQMVEHYFPGLVDLAYGQRDNIPLKPDPAALYEICSHFGVSEGDCIYIGDSDVDVITGKRGNVACIAVSWGFCTKDQLMGSGATIIVDKVQLLAKKIVDILESRDYTS